MSIDEKFDQYLKNLETAKTVEECQKLYDEMFNDLKEYCVKEGLDWEITISCNDFYIWEPAEDRAKDLGNWNPYECVIKSHE